MSELTPEELIEEINFTVQDASVIPVPIDPTLSHQGEAADAKATGDAIANVLDGMKVNNKSAVNKAFTIYAGDIAMSSEEGAQTITEALESVAEKDASEIMYDAENLVSIADALDDIADTLDSELSTEEIDDIFDEVFGGDE